MSLPKLIVSVLEKKLPQEDANVQLSVAHMINSLQAMSCDQSSLPPHPLLKLLGSQDDCKQTAASDEQPTSSSAGDGSDVALTLGQLNLRDDDDVLGDAILSPPARHGQSVIDYYSMPGQDDEEERGRQDSESPLRRKINTSCKSYTL